MFSSLLVLVGTFSATLVNAGNNGNFSDPCTQADNRLSFGTYQLSTDCESTLYCADNNTCANKGCRRDQYPFGYALNATLPPYCPKGQFCPDEEDQCLPQLAVGSPCQLNRDDECAPPDNSAQLAGPRNTNGAICLNFVCQYANATLGTTCIVENIPYVVYDQAGGKEYVTIVSRDNCVTDTYCDGTQKQCVQQKDIGATCDADKECKTQNCNTAGKCDDATNTTIHVATWVYAVVGAAILGGMLSILVTLYIFHSKNRKVETEKRAQYWREQEAFRNNILSMREQARASTLSLPRGGDSYRDDYGNGQDSSRQMMYPATKSSGLRNHFADDNTDADSMEESLVPSHHDDPYGDRRRTGGPGGRM